MEPPIGDTVYAQAIPAAISTPTNIEIPEAGQAQEVEEPFDTPKAVNYNVANLGASVFYSMFNFGMPIYLSSYGLPAPLIGLLANERSFVGAFVQPIVGRISDHIRTPLGRRRPFFLIGVPLVCVGLFLLAAHPPLWEMIAIMSVLAFFLAVAWDPYMALMADLFPPKQRGRVGGLNGLGTGIGNIVFALMALKLWADNEFLVFSIVIVLLLVTWGWTFFTVKEPASPDREENKQLSTKPNPIQYVKNLMEYPEAAKYTLAVNFFWLGTGGVIPFITLFGIKVLHTSESQAFLLPMAATVANALLAVPVGYLADRTSKKTVMSIGMLIYAVVALLGSQSQTLWQGILALTICGGANAAMAQINPMLTDLVPRKRMAEFVGLGSAVFSFAQPLGSVLAGGVVMLATLAVGGEEAYRWAFITAGLMVLTSGLLLRTVHPERALKPEDL